MPRGGLTPSCALARNPVNCRAMERTDEGIVLGVRRHGESSAIVELLTRAHGRHLGLVRGGAGSRMRPLLQPGNSLSVVWRGRVGPGLRAPMHQGAQRRGGGAAGADPPRSATTPPPP